METVARKRIEIVAEATFRRRLSRLLDDLEVTGYTVVPVMGGRGESGEWSREGQVSAAGEMVLVICITSAERADTVIEAALGLISAGKGVLSVSDVRVVRGARF